MQIIVQPLRESPTVLYVRAVKRDISWDIALFLTGVILMLMHTRLFESPDNPGWRISSRDLAGWIFTPSYARASPPPSSSLIGSSISAPDCMTIIACDDLTVKVLGEFLRPRSVARHVNRADTLASRSLITRRDTILRAIDLREIRSARVVIRLRDNPNHMCHAPKHATSCSRFFKEVANCFRILMRRLKNLSNGDLNAMRIKGK